MKPRRVKSSHARPALLAPGVVRAGLGIAVTAAALLPSAAVVPAVAMAAPPDPDMSTRLAGKTVFLDPGHQGTEHDEDLSRPVNDGRGGTKECQTTGMTTVNGVPEHTITWNVSQLVKQSLEAMGARVELSRRDDTGWGGCVDERAAAANRSGADVAISLHADSAPAQERGFHLIVPQLPAPDVAADVAQSGGGQAATQVVRDAYQQAGMSPAGYGGAVDGVQTRDDIAGPALTHVPNVFLEMGNGANADDAAQLESQDGQLKHAVAIATGLAGYLIGRDGAPAPSGSAGGPAAAHTEPGQPNVPPAQPAAEPNQPDPLSPQRNSEPAQSSTAPTTPKPAAAQPSSGAPSEQPTGAPQASSPVRSTPEATTPEATTTPTPSAAARPPGSPAARSGAAAPTTTAAPGSAVAPPSSQPSPSAAAPSTTGRPQPGAAPTTDKQSQGQGQSGTDDDSGAGSLATTAMKLLAPLAESLGLGDAELDSQLVDLAYSLAATVMGTGSADGDAGQGGAGTHATG